MAKKKYKFEPFAFIAFILFLFFVIPFFIHKWASTFPLRLHFCNHFACVIYSLIWLALAIVGWLYLKKKGKIRKKARKALIIIAIVVLIVGIILMNITHCDSSGIHFSSFSNWFIGMTQLGAEPDGCKPGVDCPVPIPPCIDTDDGHDYISYGEIRSGLDIGDKCMTGDILRERFCSSTLTYSSEDIDCGEEIGALYICNDGECVLGEPAIRGDLEECYEECYEEVSEYCISHSEGIGSEEYNYCMESFATAILECEADCDEDGDDEIETNCGDSLDNDGDTFVDCDDSDCQGVPTEDGGCADFDFSCEHTSPYPTCGGTCSTGEKCVAYPSGVGWCECMPDEETVCGELSGCDGWCIDSYVCLPTIKGCECIFDNGICYESDEGVDWANGGYCYDFSTDHLEYDDCASSQVLFEQTCRLDAPISGCDTYAIICGNDSSFGLYPEMGYECLEEYPGAICGTY